MFQDGSEGPPTYSRRDAARVKHGHMLYMTAHLPASFKAQNTGLEPKGTNFTRACGLMPAVRRVKQRRSAAANGTNSNAEALQHSNTTAEPTTT